MNSSIHMPDYTPGPDAFHIGGASGIVLKKDGSIIDYIWWDHLSYGGYKFFNSTYGQNTGHTNPINVSSFDTVEFKGIPVYNTEKTNTQYNPSLKLRTRILRNGNEIYSNDSAGLIKSGFNYPVDTYSIDWKTLKTSLVTSVQNGDVFRVYVCLIEQNSNGGLMTETLHGEFNFSFTAL